MGGGEQGSCPSRPFTPAIFRPSLLAKCVFAWKEQQNVGDATWRGEAECGVAWWRVRLAFVFARSADISNAFPGSSDR